MQLKRLDEGSFDRFLAIMECSFPRDERREAAEQRALLTNPAYTPLLVCDEAGTILGFITLWDVGDYAFVEHFAVAPEYRNRGLGAQILRLTVEQTAKPLCLEVEPPLTEIARRRIAFYERNGFVLNDYPYEQPAYTPDRASVPLLIMTLDGGIDRKTFEQVRTALYRRVYGR
jgi:GNAT superfamily N-acetyltransferase